MKAKSICGRDNMTRMFIPESTLNTAVWGNKFYCAVRNFSKTTQFVVR